MNSVSPGKHDMALAFLASKGPPRHHRMTKKPGQGPNRLHRRLEGFSRRGVVAGERGNKFGLLPCSRKRRPKTCVCVGRGRYRAVVPLQVVADL